MRFVPRMVAAAALLAWTSLAHAQMTDITGQPAGSLPGGAFIPYGGTRSARMAIVKTAAAFSKGLPSDTSEHIAPAAAQLIGSLIGTPDSPASVPVATALTAAGAPAGPVNTLVTALANLAGTSDEGARAAIIAAVIAYNDLVAVAPASLLRNPPPEFLAIKAALAQIVSLIL